MARQEAIRLQHDRVGAEHALLALIRDGGGMAVTVLANLHVDPQQVGRRVAELAPPGKGTAVQGESPYTREAKNAIETAMAAARELEHSCSGPEHLLLGVAAAGGLAAKVLGEFGATPDVLKAALAAGGEAPRGSGRGSAGCRGAALPHPHRRRRAGLDLRADHRSDPGSGGDGATPPGRPAADGPPSRG
jgi:ATP-dependent Clp protease ATP-binding subunit ClpC|nr:MAG: hypothetical protein DIU52_07315 [bacterium]